MYRPDADARGQRALGPMLAELAGGYDTIENPELIRRAPVLAAAFRGTCWSSWRSSGSASRQRCA